jgi:hypothetical protein
MANAVTSSTGSPHTGAPAQSGPSNFATVVPVRPGDADFEERAKQLTTGTWDRLKNAYIVYHQSVWEALLFYVNQSWIKPDSERKLWQPQIPDDDFTPQPRINRFAPSVDAISSNFQVPEVEFTPAKPDDNVSNAVADIASILADHFMKDNGLKQDMRQADEDAVGDAAQLFVLAGCCFSRVYPEWEKLGEVPLKSQAPGVAMSCANCDFYSAVPAADVVIGPDGTVSCPTCGRGLQPEQTTVMVPAQDDDGQPLMMPIMRARAICKMGSPLCAFPRPGSKTMNNSNTFLWAERFTLDEIYRLWQYDAEPDNVWPDGYSITYESALNYYYLGFAQSAAQMRDAAMVLQMFVEPGKTKEFPEGLYCVCINSKLVCAHGWKELFSNDHPITKATYLGIPHLFFPRSVSFDLVEIQKETNSYEALIKLHGMTTAAEPVVVDENTVVSEITGRGDKLIYWKAIGPGSKEPHRMQHGSLDDGVYKQVASLRSDFQNISMAVNVFRGQQEGSASTGVAINALRAQAEQMFSRPSLNWSAFIKETVRKGVKCIQRHYTLAQLQEIVGPDRATEIQQFKTADLDTMTECVATSHGLPKTRDERRQEMMALFDKGALDIQDPNVKQKIFQLFGETGMMKTFNLDASRARRENNLMRQGQPVQVMPEFEDMAVHLSQHLDKIKGADFDSWPPGPKQLLMEHTLETRNAMAQQAAAAAAAAGGPPAGAPPSGAHRAGAPPLHPKVVHPPQPQPQPLPGGGQ